MRVGYPGTACVIPKGFGDLNAASLVIIRPNPEKLNSHYLAYVINSPWGKSAINGRLVGAAQQVFNTNTAAELEIPCPSILNQNKIAAILSTYDDLIENNMRRIKILEEMAQNLYREWFLNFRFPGHEKVRFVDSHLGKIPEGWEVDTVNNSFSILGGGTPSKKAGEYWTRGKINWYTPSDLTAAKTMFIDNSSLKITELGLKKSSAKLFPAFSVMMTSRATLGVVSINTTEACTNQGFITCIPNNKCPLYYLYFWLKENVESFIKHASGATFKEISKGVFKTLELIIPDREATTQFESILQPVGLELLNLQRRNTILSQTRDFLLPKIIFGEVDVSSLDIELPVEA